jgi:hypothetical protein
MPLQYQLDDAKRRIRVTLADPVTVADLFESIERQLADGVWSDGTVIEAWTSLPAPRASEMPRSGLVCTSCSPPMDHAGRSRWSSGRRA